jgi:hypothetical protein
VDGSTEGTHVTDGTEIRSGGIPAARPWPFDPRRLGFFGPLTVAPKVWNRGAYRQLLDRGYRPDFIGVTLHHPDTDAYHHPDAYVIDDWR